MFFPGFLGCLQLKPEMAAALGMSGTVYVRRKTEPGRDDMISASGFGTQTNSSLPITSVPPGPPMFEGRLKLFPSLALQG